MDFKGRLKVAGAGGAGIATDLRLDDIYLELWSEGEELGVWRLDVVEVTRSSGNRFALDLDGEAMEFEANDPLGFAYEGLTFINEVAGKLRKKRRGLRKGEDSNPLRGARIPAVERPAAPAPSRNRAPEPTSHPIGARLEQARAGGRYEPLPPAEAEQRQASPTAEPARTGIGAFLSPVQDTHEPAQPPAPPPVPAPDLTDRLAVPVDRAPAPSPLPVEPVAAPMVIIEEVGAFSWAADVIVEPLTPEPAPVSAPEPVVVPEPVVLVPEPEPEPVVLVPEPEPEPVEVPEPVALVPEPEPEPVVVPEPVALVPEPEPEQVVVPEPVALVPEPEPEPEPVVVAEPVALVPEPEPEPVVVPEPVALVPEPEPEPVALVPEPEPEPVAFTPEPAVFAPEPESLDGALEPVFGSSEMPVFDREPLQKGRLRRGSRAAKKASANGSVHASEQSPVGFAESPTELDLTPVFDVDGRPEVSTEFRERGRHATTGKGRAGRRRKPDDHNHEYDIARTVGGLTRRICVHCGHVSFDSEDVYQGWG